MNFTQQEYRAALVRLDKNKVRQSPGEPVKHESDLHDDIIALCKERGWYYVHSRMDRRHTNAVGTPDFIIAMDDGRIVWLECKAKGNKATTEQLAALAWLQKLGHKAGLVTNMGEVMELLNENGSAPTAKCAHSLRTALLLYHEAWNGCERDWKAAMRNASKEAEAALWPNDKLSDRAAENQKP